MFVTPWGDPEHRTRHNQGGEDLGTSVSLEVRIHDKPASSALPQNGNRSIGFPLTLPRDHRYWRRGKVRVR